MRAIILAAGRGRRNFPYDLTRQKAAMPIADTYLVRWTVNCLQRAGITDIMVVVGYLHQRVRHALLGLDVEFVTQGSEAGTAPAVLDAMASCGADEPLLVLYGDCLIDEQGIRDFVDTARLERPFAAAMLSPLEGRNSLDWICGSSDDDRLAGISGHPRSGRLRMCGVYYLSPPAVPFVRANPGVAESVNVGGMPKMEAELAQSVQLMIDAGHEVRAVTHRGLFVDIDKPWHVLEANGRFAEYICGRLQEDEIADGARISDSAEIAGVVKLGPGCIIGNRVVIGGNLIAGEGTQITNGAIVHANCVFGKAVTCRDYCLVGSRSTVGTGALIGHGAELGGVAFEGAYLYHYCEMAGVLGARHDVGAATVCGTLRFDDADTRHQVQGRKEYPDGGANVAYFGDYTRTGVNAIIMPGVKVGAYSCIGPGVVQYDDVDHRTLVTVKQETITRPWGPERYGW